MAGIITVSLQVVLISNSHSARYIMFFSYFIKEDNLALGDEVIYSGLCV